MRIRVYYVSPKGSAEKIANAVARAIKCVGEPLWPAYMPENVTIMFLGCEGPKADKVTMEFIATLNPDRVANAALFHCGKDPAPLSQMRQALIARGIDVMDMTLNAPLKGILGHGLSEQDCERAAQFAQDCLRALATAVI